MYDFPAPLGTSRYEDDVYAVLARLERTTLPSRPIAFFGSSSFRLWTSMAQDLGSLDVVNLGFGGGTNVSGLHYFDRLVLPMRPQAVVLYFGENDIANDGLTAQTSFDHLRALRHHIRDVLPSTKVFVLSTKNSPTRWIYADEVDRYNTLTRDWCADLEDTVYVDVSSALLGENGRPAGRFYVSDFIHLNASGYAIWAEILQSVPDLQLAGV